MSTHTERRRKGVERGRTENSFKSLRRFSRKIPPPRSGFTVNLSFKGIIC